MRTLGSWLLLALSAAFVISSAWVIGGLLVLGLQRAL
jgi:hypothetical protein